MDGVLRLHNLTVDCIVGCYPQERHEPQTLIVEIDVNIPAGRAAFTESLVDAIDYAVLSTEIVFLVQHARFRLLETAASVIARYVLKRSVASEAKVRLRKPAALVNGAVEVQVQADRSDLGFYGDDVVHFTPLRLVTIIKGELIIDRAALLADDGVTGEEGIVSLRLQK